MLNEEAHLISFWWISLEILAELTVLHMLVIVGMCYDIWLQLNIPYVYSHENLAAIALGQGNATNAIIVYWQKVTLSRNA